MKYIQILTNKLNRIYNQGTQAQYSIKYSVF